MPQEQPSTDVQQQTTELEQQLDENEQQEQQNSQSSDWTSGIDLVEIGSGILDAVGDLISNIDINIDL